MVRKDPSCLPLDMRAGVIGALPGYGEERGSVEVEREPELIPELLRVQPGLQPLADAVHDPRRIRRLHRHVLEPTAHQRAVSPVPDAARLGDHELHAPGNARRRGLQQPVSHPTQLDAGVEHRPR